MITAPPAPERTETDQVHAATVRKLAGKRTSREKQTAKRLPKASADGAGTATGTAGKNTSTRPTTKRATISHGSQGGLSSSSRSALGV